MREIYRKFVPVILNAMKDPGNTKTLDSSVSPQNDETTLLSQTLLNELIWREFWYHIAYYFPFTYSLEFQERRRSIVWNTDETSYEWEMFQK